MIEVKIIKIGYHKALSGGRIKASSNITLIKNKMKIIVDTGSIGDSKKIIDALKKEKLKLEDIDFVINTHRHPDHCENNFLFTNATFIEPESKYRGDLFGIKFKLPEDITIIQTPGHSLHDCTVLVKTKKGTIAIVGDMIWDERDLKKYFRPFNFSSKLQLANRRKILKIADYIIPGHGKMFKVKK